MQEPEYAETISGNDGTISRAFFFKSLIIFGAVELAFIVGVGLLAFFLIAVPHIDKLSHSSGNELKAVVESRISGNCSSHNDHCYWFGKKSKVRVPLDF